MAADGKCCNPRCRRDLEPGWHGDHINPHSAGGPTDVVNGQALCPECNLKKGSRALFNDQFTPRPFQSECFEVVRSRIGEGNRVTVVWVGPGGGKTLNYQNIANQLLREGIIDTAAVYAPRSSLAVQCEIGYQRDRGLFDPSLRFDAFLHNINRPPFTPRPLVGFVSTYSALNVRANLHLDWARRNAGRFLLVVDEAQFCGCDDAERATTGTAAARNIEALHEFSAHTLVLTGTPYRSDKSQIVLAGYYEKDGRKKIDWHVRSTYADGISMGYLRQFESRVSDAMVTRRNIDIGTVESTQLSADSRQLGEILRCDEVWRPIVDQVVVELKDAKEQWRGYKALIACMEQSEARNVASYLRARHPNMSVALALSDDGADAQKALREFKSDDTNILVTVRMAFVGYDCNRISVIGCLTNYRDHGHLEQLIGRGLRVDNESGIQPRQQKCRIVAPDDSGMQSFLEYLRQQQERGIAPPGPGGIPPEKVEYVESAAVTETRIVGLQSDVSPAVVAYIDECRREFGVSGSVSDISRMLDKANPGWRTKIKPEANPKPADSPPMTERERVLKIKSECSSTINRTVAARLGEKYSQADFQDAARRLRAAVNKRAGIKSVDAITTVEPAERYQAKCKEVCGE